MGAIEIFEWVDFFSLATLLRSAWISALVRRPGSTERARKRSNCCYIWGSLSFLTEIKLVAVCSFFSLVTRCGSVIPHLVIQTERPIPAVVRSLGTQSVSKCFAEEGERNATSVALYLQFKSKGGSALKEYCEFLTKEDCRRNRQSFFACEKVHFRRIIMPHTDVNLGDCSFLDTCRHMKVQ